jgi:hypothetical protein
MLNFCVDQSKFRCTELKGLIDSTNARFVITDAALMEMCQSDRDWERTLRNSLRYLSAVPDRVCFVPGNGDCLKMELRRREPLTLRAMISDQMTIQLQDLLAEVASEQSGSAFRQMAGEIEDANRDAQGEHFDHSHNREQLRDLVEFCRERFPESFLKRLRANKVDENEYIRFVSRCAATATNDSAMSLPTGTLGSLTKSKAYTMRWLWLRVETVTDWLKEGGIESVTPKKVTNTDIDNHYLVVGSYCDRMLTKDQHMLEKDRRLRAALRLKIPWKKAWREV